MFRRRLRVCFRVIRSRHLSDTFSIDHFTNDVRSATLLLQHQRWHGLRSHAPLRAIVEVILGFEIDMAIGSKVKWGTP